MTETIINDRNELLKIGIVIGRLQQISRTIDIEIPAKLVDVGSLGTDEIGCMSYIGPNSEIKNAKIGRFCSIARNVAIAPPEHPVDWVSSHPIQYNGLNWFKNDTNWDLLVNTELKWKGNSQKTTIGNDVWIGRNVVIRRGVTIGDGAIVGSNSFINRDVPPYTIVAGQPAKIIKKRFSDETIEKLTNLKWWNWAPKTNQKLPYDNPELFIENFLDMKKREILAPLKPRRVKIENRNGTFYLSEKTKI